MTLFPYTEPAPAPFRRRDSVDKEIAKELDAGCICDDPTCPDRIWTGQLARALGSLIEAVQSLGRVGMATRIMWPVKGEQGACSDPTCFPAETMVNSPTGAEKVSCRWYEGEMVDITTVGQQRLSGTPNHPVLTSRGWVPLGLLVEGDYVVSRRLGQEVEFGDRDIQHVYAQSGQSDDLPAILGPLMRERAVDQQLNRQPIGIQVHVVAQDSLLGNGFHSPDHQPLLESHLPGPNGATKSLTPKSGIEGLGIGNRPSPHGVMSSSGEQSALLMTEPTHAEPVGFTTPSHDASPLQVVGDCGEVDAEAARDARRTLSGTVAADQIVSIKRSSFRGHVYNLQTPGRWYIANGIVVHNCHYEEEMRQALCGVITGACVNFCQMLDFAGLRLTGRLPDTGNIPFDEAFYQPEIAAMRTALAQALETTGADQQTKDLIYLMVPGLKEPA